MKLFEMKNWQLTVSEEAWGLLPFKNILERDDSNEKELALKEMLFIFYFCDIKSVYVQMDEDVRIEEIKKDIGLSPEWEVDDLILEGIKLYEKHSQSVIEKLYKQAIKSASDIGDYLENTKELLEERDDRNKPVTDISKFTTALSRVPKLMADLKASYKEVVREQEDLTGRKKGSREFNTFEKGLEL